ncbi:MAG: hypothetical protein ACYTEX_25940 [Planctomycetota bacterium]|jgi:hypothetical protein
MLRTTKAKILAVFLVVGAGALGFSFLIGEIEEAKTAAPRTTITVLIRSYIEQQASFPGSETELEEKGFLKKVTGPEDIQYFVRYYGDSNTPWYRVSGFDRFRVSYGIDPEKLKILEGKLVDKASETPVLLIDGPYKERYGPTYESISLWWYERMVEKAGGPAPQ